ncbi:hypothetical protein PFISCL1PPCAC_14153, partial [Pristionchus fissidentatus]
ILLPLFPRMAADPSLPFFSPMDLQLVCKEWYCSYGKCKGPCKKNGGFGVYDERVPYFLNCGHYVCGDCIQIIDAGLNVQNGYIYTCSLRHTKRSDAPCEGAAYVKGAIGEIGVALHIKEWAPILRRKGLACWKCPKRNNTKHEYYHDRKVMVVNDDVSKVLMDKDTPKTVAYLTRALEKSCGSEPDKVTMCEECARVHGGTFKRVIDIQHYVEILQSYPLLDTNHLTHLSLKKRTPWHLVSLSKNEINKLASVLMRCGKCEQNYNSNPDHDKAPRALPCGHLYCKQCSEDAKLGKCPHLHCQRATYKGTKLQAIPRDEEVLLLAHDKAQTRMCSVCGRQVPENYTYKISNDMGIDAWYCLHCCIEMDTN